MCGSPKTGLCLLLLSLPCGWADEEGAGEEAAPATPPVLPYAEARDAFTAAAESGGEALETAALELARSAAASADEAEKKEACTLLKRLLKERDDRILIAAFRAFGTLARTGTSKDLKRYVDYKLGRNRSVEVRCAAIDAWGRIHDPRSQEALLRYVRLPSDDKDDLELAKAAVTALGYYAGLPQRDRYEFLKDYMKTFNMVQSAGASSFMPSAAAAEWWRVLQDPMVAAFNAAAGTKHASHKECSDWWNENHRQVKAGNA